MQTITNDLIISFYSFATIVLTILIAVGKRMLTKLETVNKAVNHVDDGQPLTKRVDMLAAAFDKRGIEITRRHEETQIILTDLQIQTKAMAIVMDKILLMQQQNTR